MKCSEAIEEEVQAKGSKSSWKGNLSSLQQALKQKNEGSIELAIPVQPKTKVVSRDLAEKEEKEVKDQRNGNAVNKVIEYKQSQLKSKTFINCDLRFFNLNFLVDQLGHFEVVHIDPPWRIKGAQRNNSSFMFSNNKFNLEYSTMSNQEIINIPVETLATKGFCFLWILNS